MTGDGRAGKRVRTGARIETPYPAPDEAEYTQLYPYYAELCALSELRKKPDCAVPIRSGIGGHSLLYLNGVRCDRNAGYPVLRLCAPQEGPELHGAGISVNSHYRNANWVAAEGRDFLWRGTLAPGEALTAENYARTQARAKAQGVLDGVEFHPHFLRGKPPEMPERDYMYEISVATDYALCFGRDAYRLRVPLDAVRMGAIVDYLNTLNAPYRAGERHYHWRIFNNNCSHIAHNALAAAGIWAHWPTGQFPGFAAFCFPVPKNELVDLALRCNDLPVHDPQLLYKDKALRRAFLETGALPAAPGALASFVPAIKDNALYDVAGLRLIFFDDPFLGPYRFRFARIFSDPRFLDLRENLRHFSALYQAAAENLSVRFGHTNEHTLFQAVYGRYIKTEMDKVHTHLAMLEESTKTLAEALQ